MNNIFRYKRIKRRNVKSKSTSIENNICNNNDDVKIEVKDAIGPLLFRNILSSKKSLFFSLLAFRIINSLINQTSYVPDEYWQSVEVAHKWIFQNGYLTWEWLPEFALRSPLYPLLFAIPFKILFLIGLDHRLLVIKLPMIIHGILAAIGDFYLYVFSFKLSGQKVAQWTLFNQLINWFTFYSCTRTLINNIEWLLVILVLCEYQIISKEHTKRSLSKKFVLFASLCLILRPTGVIVLIPICLYHAAFQMLPFANPWPSIYRTFINCLSVGLLILFASLIVEKHFYGRWTCSQLNFLHFNLLTDVSQMYGVHPWHWYISNALPSMLLTQLPILVIGIWSEWNDHHSRKLIGLMLFVLYSYSCIGHKEFRFVFPIMPIAMHLLGCMFVRFPSKRKLMIAVLMVTQIPIACYMCLIHQRGTNDIVMAIGRRIEQAKLDPRNISAVFLMPCHSTPFYSHFHYNISARFLTCDPQITGSIQFFNDPIKHSGSLRNYDEADRFYNDPRRWLIGEYSNITRRPLLLVMFDRLVPDTHSLLIQWEYQICKRVFHAHFPTHSRHSSKIVVYCLQNRFF